MLCFQCGSAVSADDSKCPNCGADLQKGSQRRKSRVATGGNLQRFTQQLKPVVVEEQALFSAGTILDGRFKVDAPLGKGPFGQTFVAHDAEQGEAKIVIKALRPAIFAGADELDRFRLTLKKARRLEQRSLVKILGGGVHELTPWLAMEFVEGLSLREAMKLRTLKNERFSVAEVEALISPLITALQRAHREFPHGNLRPENLYYSPERLKIADYYLMAMLPPGAWREPLGSSQYLAPELREGKGDLHAGADVYAIGALVSEMLFGQIPSPAKVDGALEQLKQVCQAAMQSQPSKRPSSLEELGELFATAFDAQTLGEQRSEPLVAPPAPPGAPMMTPPPAPPQAPTAPPQAPKGVEAPAKPEATQILDEAEVEVISAKTAEAPKKAEAKKAETPKKAEAKPAPEKKPSKRPNRRPMPKDEEVAATAISGSGESASGPKPVPTPPKDGAKAKGGAKPAPKAEAEDELETIDLKRGAPELGDLLPTNDLARGQIPSPRPPRLERENTKSTLAPVAPPKAEPAKGGIPPWAIILGVAAVVIVVVLIASQDNGKKVTIVDDSTNSAANASNTASPKPEEKPAPTPAPNADMGAAQAADPAKDASTQEAAQKVALAQDASTKEASAQAASAQAPAVEPPKETPTVEAPKVDDKPKVDPKLVAAATTPKDNSAKIDDKAKVDPKVDPKAKTDAQGSSATDKTAAASAGTKCPGGMVLLKSSSGAGVCVDAREYPGSGVPKTGVSWFQAKKLCEGRGKRLCGLKEWRSACGSSKYPYGSKWDPDRCNTQDEDEFDRQIAATGSFSKCKSKSGAYDMVGNVHEWVEEAMVVGGGYDSGPKVASCQYASTSQPSSQAKYLGFRCCADPQ